MCAHSCTSFRFRNCLGQIGHKLSSIVLGQLYSFTAFLLAGLARVSLSLAETEVNLVFNLNKKIPYLVFGWG
jgi:hypothetical protein